ncbi:hypothetical protein F967_00716 [Acinetobacter sp. CIP 102637]|uniref:restriction endonuclease subunit S n=1 Tax=unclassified Acinetobacter TaxID=196816 RepID=UPI0002D02034|nr:MULTISPECIES: restriction endonuclease subunit S [unclassified Acinetobacter]ENU86300.1 hypothetical protein F973_01214 [Acinetobacter sp. CIP 102129]ENV06740.1 hypothetical protein F967_00716 [Acinetobacter sp. CIP 102637]
MSFYVLLKEIAEIEMGQSPTSNNVNSNRIGLPLLNGPTEFTSRYPIPIQFTESAKKISQKGDILFCVRGSTTGRMNYADRPYAIGRGLAAIRGKNGYPTSYIRVIVEQNLAKLLAAATGSTFPNVGRDLLLNFKVQVLSKNEAQYISNIVDLIDNKIHLNNQINQTLESIAQAIFKCWFIDFEPVRAKIAAKQEGKDPELAAMCAISGKSEVELKQMASDDFAELQATAVLFPDELVESELGEVPRGWEVGCIGDEVNTVSKTYPLKQVEEVIFLNTGDILEGKFLHANKSRTESLPGQAKKSIQKDDILYSEIRPQNKRFAYVYFDAEDYVVSTKLMVLRKKSTIPSHFVYFILSRQSTIDFLQVMAESRSGTFPQITFDVLSKVEYLKPNNNALIDIFTRKVLSPFFDKKVMNETENNKLIGVRDNLLPKLLSGEMDVSDLQSEGD